MKTLMYVMSDDTKWLEREEDLPFTPHPGIDLDSIAGGQSLRVSGMSYDVVGQFFKLRLSWLSMDAIKAQDMLNFGVGWKIVGEEEPKAIKSDDGPLFLL